MQPSTVFALVLLCLAQTVSAACETRTVPCSESACDSLLKPGAFPCGAAKKQSDADCSVRAKAPVQTGLPVVLDGVLCECCDAVA
ncbi:hypothetical protein CPLU01_06475 [Colletotrichum plurivorum]|uniref:Uncharacterized protein n=1 Tax=Colletotrichum plurivorum TaxID=2175906 RepID=A0A8H6KIN7_9PEZI|nr:hypothetical protein CPLU01_06475 [Colletotrichum plurivorum]